MTGLRLPSPRQVTVILGLSVLFCFSACQRKKPIVIATKPGDGQILLGEIVAQHLGKRLPDLRIEQRPAAGGTAILFQQIAGGDITIYPETTADIAAILKEQPSADPAILLERDRLEMARTAQLELFELGYDDGPAVVIPGSWTGKEKTLSAAAEGKERWKLAMTPEFEQSADFPALNRYHLPMAAPLRTVALTDLFDAATRGEVNMVVTTATDSHLTSDQWRVLEDDKKQFPGHQMCLLARQDRLMAEPRLRPALRELAGKLNPEILRKLNQQIELAHGDVAGVARRFVAGAGL